MVSLVDGVTRQIEWPENAFFHAPLPGAGRDSILLLGIEPNLRWRTFAGLVTQLAGEFGVELVITLGSLLADVPHTRPSPVTGSATDPQLIDQLGLSTSRYEGPTGMVGVLHDACGRAGIASASLWAAVPHYVSLTPSPRAAKALVDRLGEPARRRRRHRRARGGVRGVLAPGEPGGRDRPGDGDVRRGARAPDGRPGRRRRRAVGRVDRRRAEPLPARARERRPAASRSA